MIHCYKGKNASHWTEVSDAMKKFDLLSQVNVNNNNNKGETN